MTNEVNEDKIAKIKATETGLPPSLCFIGVEKVVVHGGESSHQDEQVACALAHMAGADVRHIERHDPTQEEIDSTSVLVLDVGGVHDPAKFCFDHHQLPREAAPACSYSLLADFLGLREKLAALYPWFEDGVVLDSKGPIALAKGKGTSWDKVQGLLGPAGGFHDRMWAQNPAYREFYSKWLGEKIERELDDIEIVGSLVTCTEIAGLKVMDCRHLTRDQAGVQDALVRQNKPQVIWFNDDRGPGYGFMRISDDPHVDFAQCQGRPDVGFAHKDGFIVKTTSKEVDVADLLKAAYKA